MKILFAGTAEIAVDSLEHLAKTFDVAAVLTVPDRPRGRGRKITETPVKSAAKHLGLPVLQPDKLGSEARRRVSDYKPDLLVVFAYGRIFGPKFLDLFPQGAINLHPSALPLYRGPSPISAVILAGERQSALTVQSVSLKMDGGDILRQSVITLDGKETTGSLTERVSRMAPAELEAVIRMIAEKRINPIPQDESQATYCYKMTKSDRIIRWSDSAVKIERMIRAFQPRPKARTTFGSKKLAILEAKPYTDENSGPVQEGSITGVDRKRGILIQTGEGLLGVTRIQPATRNPCDFLSYAKNSAIEAGMKFGG